MSAATAVVAMPKRPRSKKDADPIFSTSSHRLRHLLRESAGAALAEGLRYKEAQELFRWFLLDTALRNKSGVKKAAAAALGISRDHVRDYHRRGKGIS